MSLSKHHHRTSKTGKNTLSQMGRFTDMNEDVSKYRMSKKAMDPEAAAAIIRGELKLDGNPDLNLASFVGTDVDKECLALMVENLSKNLADTSEYPHTVDIQERCVSILADLFHAPPAVGSTKRDDGHSGAVGTATVGSSEAILLGGLALKWRWQARQAEKLGKTREEILQRPNLIFGGAVHVSVLKVCRYFDIEPRIIPLEHGRYTLDIDLAIAQCDENTCGVVAVLGTTLTGELEDVKGLNAALLKLKAKSGWDIPIHVDGASGAMIAPFIYQEIEWDFRLEQVRSINVSGHKFGLVLAGLGWIIWRRKEDLPEGLIFHVNYLGEDEATYGLNFSRSAAPVIAQYYQFLRLGVAGYARIMQLSMDNSKFVAQSLSALCEGLIILHSKHDRPALPLVAFSFNPEMHLKFNETALVHSLRERGWIIPAYTLAANASDITVCRIVVRENFTRNMAAILVEDIRLVIRGLAELHGHKELVETLNAAKDDAHYHRRSSQHAEKLEKIGVIPGQSGSKTKDKAKATTAKDGDQTVHTIC